MRLWAAANLAELPTRIIFHDTREAKETFDEQGRRLRYAFQVVADPHNKREFRIRLLRGATEADLERAKLLVTTAQLGAFNSDIWRFFEESNTWVSGVYWSPNPDHEHLALRVIGACKTVGCVDQYHRFVDGEIDGSHTLTAVRCPDDLFSVHAYNLENGAGWMAWIDLSGEFPDGTDGIAALRRATAEYEAMQARCDELNQIGASK